MKINNNINIRNSFMDRKIKINDISIVHKSNSQSNPTDDGVILKLSQRTKIDDVKDAAEASENNDISKVIEYGKELLNAQKLGDGYANKMTNLVEKYYSMLNELKEKYSDTNEFNYHKKYLDKAFDDQVTLFAMGVPVNTP